MKTLDADISNLIKQSKNLNHRAVILLTGENRLQRLGVVCNFIEKLGTKNILYCYVKDNKKRKIDAKGKKRKTICQSVQLNLRKYCPSEIRWCLYKEMQNILGKTFDICIFQDYELLTPNIIARGVETVSGGGLVIFLAPTLAELEASFNTSYNSSAGRFGDAQRFLHRYTVSLIASKFCICIDDQFNLLNKKKKPIKFRDNGIIAKGNRDLISLKESLRISDSTFHPMVNICATLDQARCLRTLCAAIRAFHRPSNIDDNDQRRSVTALVTAARGRGKSAALGLALCAALETGLTQICVTAPSPENVSTLWQYVKLGLKALNYSEHIDFEMTTSYLSDGVKAVTKVELKKAKFAQVIRYVAPSATESVDCDLLCIDEAAAIPLGILQMYLTSFRGLVFVASTVSGYEGSGMMLATELVDRLRQTHLVVEKGAELMDVAHDEGSSNASGKLYEITLDEPIRYGEGDPVESFLYRSLCMSYKTSEENNNSVEVDPELTADQCQLTVVNRNQLFNGSKSSEVLLQRIMAVHSASNHQNSPDDLKSLADNECSRLLCLTDSTLDSADPRVLAIIEVSFEGDINKDYVRESIRQSGVCPTVDSMSSLLVEEFLEPNFKLLSGMRIDLIATAPDYLNRGFGSRALKLLVDFVATPAQSRREKHSYGNDAISSLLMPLQALPNAPLHYIGVYSNLSMKLIKFFQRIADFIIVYVNPELNDITGECRGILLKRIPGEVSPDPVYPFNWLMLFKKFYTKRFSLLRYGYLRDLSEEYKALLENSSFPQIASDFHNLPNENIRTFSIYK